MFFKPSARNTQNTQDMWANIFEDTVRQDIKQERISSNKNIVLREVHQIIDISKILSGQAAKKHT